MKTLVDQPQQESVLAQWRGALARIWIFDVSLRRMAIRIYRPHEAEVIYVTAVGCRHIIGPFTWKDADISIVGASTPQDPGGNCRVFDQKAGFELLCGDARVVRGPATDFDKTFDNFLGGSADDG
jgi:hypothetical protein